MTQQPFPGQWSVVEFLPSGARRAYFACHYCWHEWTQDFTGYAPINVPKKARCPNADCQRDYPYTYAAWPGGDYRARCESFERAGSDPSEHSDTVGPPAARGSDQGADRVPIDSGSVPGYSGSTDCGPPLGGSSSRPTLDARSLPEAVAYPVTAAEVDDATIWIWLVDRDAIACLPNPHHIPPGDI
jgi:hypothetical protein